MKLKSRRIGLKLRRIRCQTLVELSGPAMALPGLANCQLLNTTDLPQSMLFYRILFAIVK